MFVKRRALGDRGELDDPALVAMVALLVRVPTNRAGETTPCSRFVEAPEAIPPDGVEERQLAPEEGRHASSVGSCASSKAQIVPGCLRKVLRASKRWLWANEAVTGAGLGHDVARPRGVGLDLSTQLRDVDVEVV